MAARYEELSAAMFAPEEVTPAVEFLAGLAWDGRALELGVGTGRLALPLGRRGCRVHGIDRSPAMVARLREKPGADAIDITIGDFSATRLDECFSLVYLAYGTIQYLSTQESQIACFDAAAGHLAAGGSFVVEVDVPPLQRLPAGETIVPLAVAPDHVGFDEIDVATQQFVSRHFFVESDGRTEMVSVPCRYVWPAELDLMARLAGLELRERWADWTREPYTADSDSHVSVWQKH
ncbi:MAG: class I SAM-dependent methyltransferase [Acidimicrobiales bacterium]